MDWFANAVHPRFGPLQAYGAAACDIAQFGAAEDSLAELEGGPSWQRSGDQHKVAENCNIISCYVNTGFPPIKKTIHFYQYEINRNILGMIF